MSRRRLAALVAPIAAAALVLSACGGSDSGQLQGSSQFKVGAQQINAKPVSQLQQGGELKWPVDQLPTNWNVNELDGLVQDGVFMVNAMFPHVYLSSKENKPVLDTNYVSSAKLTSTNPEVVTYDINPKATWSDGKPITWEDFQAQAKALSGQNQAYIVSSTTGYEDIGKVEKGTNDKQVKVTFKNKFAEWQSLFSPLYPKAVNNDPNKFNKGLLNGPGVTAGPFKIQNIDQTAKTVTVARDSKWWGPKPVLDKITFKVIDRSALSDSFNSGAIDFYQIGSSVDLFREAQQSKDGGIREAAQAQFNLTDFSGGKSSILRDQKLRVAVSQSLDTPQIAKSVLGSIQPNPKPVGNHFFSQGDPRYQDNSASSKYNPDAAKKTLDSLGWKMSGQYRMKDGKQLKLRIIETANNPISQTIDKITRDQLKRVGINGEIDPVPEDKFFSDYVNTGNYDLVGYGLTGNAFPLSSNKSVYGLYKTVQGNYSRVGNDKINELFKQGIAELNPQKRDQITQELDKEIWKVAHILPLYQVPGAYLVRKNLANFGAHGFADIDYIKAGFTKQ